MATDQPVTPLTPESIEVFDRWQALILVAWALRAVPDDFVRLWRPAYDRLAAAVREALPEIVRRLADLSPEGRGAAIAFGSPSLLLQPEAAQLEGVSFRAALEQLFGTHAGAAFASYLSTIDELLEPLAVEGLADILLLIDLKEIGLFEQLKEAGGVAGRWWDALETGLLRDITGLGPADLAKTTPGRIRERIRRKSGPLARHMKTYDLEQRVLLWIRNKVSGDTQAEIALQLQEAGKVATGGDPEARIRKHVQDINKLFRVHPLGRPRKGGALAYWNQLANSGP